MHLPDGDRQVDADREGGGAGEESRQDQQPAQKLGEGGDVAQPSRQAQSGDHLRMMVQASKNLVVAVDDHDGAQGQAHEEKSKRLQAIEIAQGFLRMRK